MTLFWKTFPSLCCIKPPPHQCVNKATTVLFSPFTSLIMHATTTATPLCIHIYDCWELRDKHNSVSSCVMLDLYFTLLSFLSVSYTRNDKPGPVSLCVLDLKPTWSFISLSKRCIAFQLSFSVSGQWLLFYSIQVSEHFSQTMDLHKKGDVNHRWQIQLII